MIQPPTPHLHDAIQAAEQAQTVQERPFVSHAPLVGPFIVGLRKAWNWMATKWYVRPLIEQQNTLNARLVASLRAAQAEFEAVRAEVERLQAEATAARQTGDTLRAQLQHLEHTILPAERRRVAAAESALLTMQREASELRRRLSQLEQDTGTARPLRELRSAQHSPRPRLAYFSPLSPLKSGIAAYSEGLLPALADQADIDLFIGDWTPTDPGIAHLPRYSYQDYPHRRRTQGYTATLYQMGNNPLHDFVYDTLLRFPGIVVVHDLFLHHFIGHRTLTQGQGDAYVWEMGYAAGATGMEMARAVVRGDHAAPAYDFPLIERVLDASLGVVCHSEYVRARLASRRPEQAIAVVGQPVQVYAHHTPRPTATDRPLTLITAAFLSPEKGLTAALEGFARFRLTYPQARYVLIGELVAWFDLPALVARLGLTDAVEIRGYAPTLEDFDRALADADICLSLRYPTAGETSASLLRALGVGVPSIVTDIGWFSEVPDAVCLKTPAPPTGEAVEAALLALAGDTTRRARMSQAAQDWIATHHSPQAAADGYLAFIQQLS